MIHPELSSLPRESRITTQRTVHGFLIILLISLIAIPPTALGQQDPETSLST